VAGITQQLSKFPSSHSRVHTENLNIFPHKISPVKENNKSLRK